MFWPIVFTLAALAAAREGEQGPEVKQPSWIQVLENKVPLTNGFCIWGSPRAEDSLVFVQNHVMSTMPSPAKPCSIYAEEGKLGDGNPVWVMGYEGDGVAMIVKWLPPPNPQLQMIWSYHPKRK